MRGPVNSPITLTIVRKGVEDPFDVKVTRDVIHINPVKYNAEGDDVGYIRVTTFNEQTTANLQKAIEDLKKQLGPKLKGYIIDLRNNPGGLLDQAISVSDAFLDQGAIVLTRGRNLEETQRSNARPGRHHRRAEDRRADQWRLGLGLGDRGGRVAGPSPRDHSRHAVLRQGLGADHHSARLEWRAQAHHRALLHAVGPLDPGQGHRARGRGRGGAARRPQAEGRRCKARAAKPICAVTSRARSAGRGGRRRRRRGGSPEARPMWRPRRTRTPS